VRYKHKMNEEETILEDWAIVAYLSLKDYLEITPFKQPNGRIALRVRGAVEPAIEELYQNCKVPITDYIKALKATRHAIFTLRGLGKGEIRHAE